MLREYRTLLPYLKKYRWSYLFGVLSLVVTSGGQLFIPKFLGSAVDIIVEGSFETGAIASLMGTMLAVSVVIAAGRLGWRFFIHGASRRIEMHLRDRLFSHLLTLSRTFYDRSKTGDLMARATNDMNAIRTAVGMALVAFIDGVFMTLAILIILFSQNARLAALIIIPLPLITVAMILVGSYIGRLFKRVQEGFSDLSDQAQEVLSGIRVVKAFVKEAYFLNRFQDANDTYKRRNLRLVRIWGLFFPVVSFLSGLTMLLLLFFGGREVVLGKLTHGDFVATLSYLEMLIWPMLGAGFVVNMLQRGGASLSRINAILDEEPDILSPPNPIRRVPKGVIRVEKLSYTYPDAEVSALKDVSFQLDQGETLGILGRTGSGKSTLLNLLPRLIDPPRGTVELDGHDVHEYDLEALRGAFGVVPQSTFLFSATISENISFALSDHDERIIDQVGDISMIARDVSEFPGGWQTTVGERGLTLSGGQKQRVAIARALAKDPEILVFDDALSAVDTETEEKILSRLLEFRSGRTNLIVSHRVSTLQHADRILVLDCGRAVQLGSHAELVKERGLYRDIYHLQQLEHEKEHR
ncbi:MAG: ABC transporter ATP-binding protein [Alkalispirochaetaceae bacterium]